MPFIVRCPHVPCQKYMLVEDEMRGTTIKCLLCGQMLQVDAPLPPATSPSTVQVQQQDERVVRTCPNCKLKMRVPPAARQVQCPQCKAVF